MQYLVTIITILSVSLSSTNQLELSKVEISKSVEGKKTLKIEEIKAGTLVRKISGTNDYEIIPQIETDIMIDIQGMVSNTILEQKFINKSDKAIEAMYVFPLNHKAAIHDMYFIVDNRIVRSQIEEKKEAKKKYTQAKKDGKRTSLLNQERPNMFTQSIANIMPNDSIIVRVKYVEELSYKNKEFELRLPLAITPRYTMEDSSTELKIKTGNLKKISSKIEDSKNIKPPFIPSNIPSARGTSIEINLDAGFSIKEVKASHQIVKQKISDKKIKIKLLKDRIIPDQDFTLNYTIQDKDEPQISTFFSEKDGEDYYMIMAIPPNPKKNKSYIPKEMTFVIDVSGSMNGNNIKYAKMSVLEALDKLNPKDYFNIIAFDDNTYHFRYNPILANEKNILEGMNFINELKGGGGTQALPALAWALDEQHNSDYIKMIIFISDGALGYENEVFKLLDSSLKDARVFSINIGYSPNSFLLEKIATMSRGSSIYIKNNTNIISEIGKLIDKINNPIISDIKIKLDDNADLYPNPINDLYHNEPILVFGKSNDLKNKITIEGRTSRGKYKETFRIKKRKLKENASVPILWARKKIEYLMNDYRLQYNKSSQKKDDLKNQIIEISKKYNILSKFTSFIAIEDIISNNTGELLSGSVPIELPKNWEYKKVPQFDKNQANSFKYTSNNQQTKQYNRPVMPSTASNNPIFILFGSILLLSSLILLFLERKFNKNAI